MAVSLTYKSEPVIDIYHYKLSVELKPHKLFRERRKIPGYFSYVIRHISKIKSHKEENIYHISLEETAKQHTRDEIWMIPPENFNGDFLISLDGIVTEGTYFEISDLFVAFIGNSSRHYYVESEMEAIQNKYPWKFL